MPALLIKLSCVLIFALGDHLFTRVKVVKLSRQTFVIVSIAVARPLRAVHPSHIALQLVFQPVLVLSSNTAAMSAGRLRLNRFWVLGSVVLALMLVYPLLASPSKRLQLVESGRLWVDYFTCSPQSHEQMLPGFNQQKLEQRALNDTCYPIDAANMDGPIFSSQLPSVYIAQAEMAQLFNCSACPETDFMTAMLANVTGNIVAQGRHADYVFVPFPATGTCTPALGKDAFPLALAAVDHLPGRKVTLHRRPFPERTNAHRPMRQLLVDYPEVRRRRKTGQGRRGEGESREALPL